MPIQITLFGDFTSLDSYLTEAALWRLAGDGALTVRPRAFERFPPPGGVPTTADEGATVERLRPLAEALDLAVAVPELRPWTRKAHEAARLGAERGVEEALRLAIYRAYWAEGRDIGRIDVLQEVVAGVGLDPVDLKIALDIDRFRDEVARDREVGERLGISAPPVVYVGTGPGARILIGAQTLPDLDAAIRRG